MFRPAVILASLFCFAALSACQLDAESYRPVVVSQPAKTALSARTPTPAPTVAIAPAETGAPTPLPTPTNTPSPTPTPIPGERLAAAQRAYTNGNYEVARQEFDALLADPGAELYEQQQALHWRGRSELNLGNTAVAIATLKMFLKQYPTHNLARAAQFNLAQAYRQSGQTEAAINAYLGTIIPDDPANVYIYEIIGDLYLRSGAYTDTIKTYQTGIESTEDVGFKVHLSEGVAQANLLYNNNPEGAIEQYKEILDVAQIASYRAKILKLLGDSYQLAGNGEAAQESYLETVNNYPEAYDSYLALVELVNAEVPVDDFQRGLIDYHAEAYQPAIAAFDQYLNPPEPITATQTLSATSPLTGTKENPIVNPQDSGRKSEIANRDEALWLTGLSWKALGQYNSAIFTFQQLIDEHPGSPHRGEAHLQIGLLRIAQENITQGKAVLRKFARQSPDDPVAAQALWNAARQDLDDSQLEDAYTYMTELAENHPDSKYAGDALYWAGQAAYLTKNHEAAIQSWEKLAETYPDNDFVSFGGYWRATALLELGQEDEAQQAFEDLIDGPREYYRLRARDRIDGEQTEFVPLAVPGPHELAQEQAEAEAWLAGWLELADDAPNLSAISDDLRNDVNFRVGDTLLELGLREEALAEFEKAKDTWWNDPPAMYQLARYFSEKRLGRLSILASARVMFLSPLEDQKKAPIFIQRLNYPLYYEDVILREASELEIDPAVVAALIRQESLFERSAESAVGARGLMQVMPATGEYVAKRSEFGPFDTDQLWRPYINIKFGAWYIYQQLAIFEGNKFAAMAAYNAGPGNVLKWVQYTDDPDTFVETIPFRESRTYIRRVYVNLAAYQDIYGVTPRE